MKIVNKVWGKELWLANYPEYCGKALLLDKGATSSYHYHKKKKETFYCVEGIAMLTIEGESFFMEAPCSEPRTISPEQKHKFYGVTDAVILEVSTFHDDNDVIRFSESQAGDK